MQQCEFDCQIKNWVLCHNALKCGKIFQLIQYLAKLYHLKQKKNYINVSAPKKHLILAAIERLSILEHKDVLWLVPSKRWSK